MKAGLSYRTSDGFTLIEVLVALAILTIALGALIRGGADVSANADYLRDKTFAHWVAMNRVAQQQLQLDWPSVGKSDGSSEFAGREWDWEQLVEDTVDGDMRRLTVSVKRPHFGGSIVRLVAYLPRPGKPQY